MNQPTSKLGAGGRTDRGGSAHWWTACWLIVLTTVGWGFAWAVGLTVVYSFNPALGWGLMGATGGLVTGLVLRLAPSSRRKRDLVLVFIGWTLGGAASVAVTSYEILTGWIAMGAFGTATTGLTLFGLKSLTGTFRTLSLVIGWLLGGVVGARFASHGGSLVGAHLAGIVGGSVLPFIVSAIASAIGGGITGAIGSVLLLWHLRQRVS